MQIASNCPPFVDSLASVRSELFSNSDAKNNMPNLQRDSDLLFLFFGRCKAHQNCALCAQHHDYFSTTNSSNSDCEARLGLGTTYKGRSQKSALCQKPGHHDSNESPTKAHPRHHHHQPGGGWNELVQEWGIPWYSGAALKWYVSFKEMMDHWI